MKPFLSLSALFLFFMASQSWAEEFRLQIGDRLEISVIRVPDVGREAMIGPDGAVRVGGVVVDVAGMTLRDAGAAIAGALSETLGVDPRVVLVDVAEYRPVSVLGGGQRGGTVAFRPGMTVIEAVVAATAGRGVDTSALSETLELQRAQARIVDAEDKLARALFLRARLVAEHDGSAFVAPTVPGISAALVEELSAAQENLMAFRSDRREQQQRNLRDQLDAVNRQIDSLGQELELARKREALTRDLLTTNEGLKREGLTTDQRLADLRSELLDAQTQVVRIISDMSEAQNKLAVIKFALEALASETSIEIAGALAQVEEQIAGLRNAITAAQRDAEAAGALGTEAADRAEQTRFSILRAGSDGARARVDALATDPVMPGDVIELVRP